MSELDELENDAATEQNSSPASADVDAAQAEKDALLAQLTDESAAGDNKGEASMPEEANAQASLPNDSVQTTAEPVSAGNSAPSDQAAPQDSSDEDDSSEDETAKTAAPSAAVQNPQMAQAIDQAIQNPQVKEYLKQKYGFGSELDDAALKAAQDTALDREKKLQIGKALNLAGMGFAQLGAGAGWKDIKNDTSLDDAKEKLINQPVQNLLARRQGIVQDQGLQTDQLKNQSLQDDVKTQLALSDPESPQSKAAQAAYLPILQKAGLDTALLKNASANTIKQVLQQPLEFSDKQKQAELIHQDQLTNQKLQREFNNDFKLQTFHDKQTTHAQDAFNKDPQVIQASKANDSINSSLDTLELARTNPIAFKANALDLAKSVLAGAGKLNQTEINQFAGGSAAFQDRLAQILDQAKSGTISPANFDYSKQLLQHLQQKNNQVIDQRQQAIAGQLSSRNGGDVNSNVQKITGKQNVPSSNQSPASPAAPSAQSDTVKIVTSDGQHLSLPKANLAAAQKRDPNLQVLQ